MRGRNPSNTKREVERPLIVNAITAALGPGTALTAPSGPQPMLAGFSDYDLVHFMTLQRSLHFAAKVLN